MSNLPHGSDITPLLAPRTIAVIGASSRSGTMGHQIVENLVTNGVTGAVYPVNKAGSAVCAVPAFSSVFAVPVAIDMAMVVVPKQHVVYLADAWGANGVKG